MSPKVDAVRERMWLNINRPHAKLRLATVLDGMWQFAALFRGTPTTETILVHMLNDTVPDSDAGAEFIAGLP